MSYSKIELTDKPSIVRGRDVLCNRPGDQGDSSIGGDDDDRGVFEKNKYLDIRVGRAVTMAGKREKSSDVTSYDYEKILSDGDNLAPVDWNVIRDSDSEMEMSAKSEDLLEKSRVSKVKSALSLKKMAADKPARKVLKRRMHFSDDASESDHEDMPGVKSFADLECDQPSTMSTMLCKLLEEVDVFRGKSRNIHGGVSGRMKKRIRFIREGIIGLTAFTLPGQSATSLEAEAVPTMFEHLQSLEKRVSKLQRFKDEADSKLQKELKKRDKEMQDLKLEYSKIRINYEKLKEETKNMAAPSVSGHNAGTSAVTGIGQSDTPGGGGRSAQDYRSVNSRKVGAAVAAIESAIDRRAVNRPRIVSNEAVIKRVRAGSGKSSNKFVVNNNDVVVVNKSYSDVLRSANARGDGEWLEVSRKKKSRPARESGVDARVNVKPNAGKSKTRLPRSEAVTIKSDKVTYAEILTQAQSKISLQEIGIENPRLRKSRAGGLVILVRGEDRLQKAEKLKTSLKSIFSGDDVSIARSVRRGELKLHSIDDSMKDVEIRNAIATIGGCTADEVKLNIIKRNAGNMNIGFASCPLTAAIKVANEGRVKVGWFSVRTELLAKRPERCFRCLASGHMQDRCPSERDRSDFCLNCCESGHKRASCKSVAWCELCLLAGRDSHHRIGSIRCVTVPPAQKVRSIARIDIAQPPDPYEVNAADDAVESPVGGTDDMIVDV